MTEDRSTTSHAFIVETVEAPDGPRAPERMQARLDTVLEVFEGVVYLVVGDDDRVLTPGDRARIPACTPYRRWNAGDEDALFVETFRVAESAGPGDALAATA